jgi:hypothetical protein
MKRVFLTFACVFILSNKSAFSATESIILSLNQKNVRENEPLILSVKTDLSKEKLSNYRLMPAAENGFVYVRNGEIWEGQNAGWSKMPTLSEEIEVKVQNVSEKSASIHFIVQDIKTGKLYKSKKQDIWSSYYLGYYLGALNKHIKENPR